MNEKPLSGIRVIDLTRVLAGPYCTMILRDLGAEIVKIETPGTGDDARQYGPFLDRERTKSAYFMSINCGKKSLALDLKSATGKEIFAALIVRADVLVENFRPGTLDRLGFGLERIRELNPTLIVAAASGFGQTGPDSRQAAYDMIIQARSGLMSITGTEAGQRVRVGSSIADIVTGMYTAIGILAALYRRSHSRIGASLDIAMLDSTISVLENAIARYQVTGKAPVPLGARHPSITPFESFHTADGEIIIAAGNDRLYATLCVVLGKPELIDDPRFCTNDARTENFQSLRAAINAVLATNVSAHWLAILSENGIPCTKINDTNDLFRCRQVAARNMLLPVESENEFKVAGNPVKFAGEPEEMVRPKPPRLGEHNEEILRDWLGFSAADIAALYREGVISP